MAHNRLYPALALASSTLLASSLSAQFTAPAGKLTETLRISGADEDLSRIGGVFIAPDGRIAFAQPQDFKILVYSPEGKRLASMGARGDGPGEFRAVGNGGWTGDSLWSYDRNSRRLVVFTSAGKHVRTATMSSVTVDPKIPLPESRTASFPPSAMLSDGGYIAYRSAAAQENPPVLIAHVTPDAQVDRVLTSHPQSESAFSMATNTGGMMFTSVPFMNDYVDFIAVDGNRMGYFSVTTAPKTEARLVIVGSKGDTLLRRSYSFSGVAITQAEKDSAIGDRVKGLTGPVTRVTANGSEAGVRSTSPVDVDAYSNSIRARMPTVHAPIQSARIGIDNTIWVQLRPVRNAQQWVMLSERGDPQVTITLPPNTQLARASRTTVWATQSDADEVQSIVRYRIDR